MAKHHNIQVNGMNYQEYAYDYIVNQGHDIEDATDEMCYEFSMREGQARTLAQRIAWNTGGFRDQIAQQITQKQEAAQLAQTPWQEHPATTRQIEYLGKLGLETIPDSLTKLQASKLIDALKARREAELDEDAESFVESILS